VVIYGPQGKQLRILGPDDGKGTPLFGPRDVARVGDRWYVVDTGGRRVVVYGDDGRPAGSWGKEGDGMIEPVGVAAEASGKLLIADTGNRRVRLTDTAGKQLAAWPVSGWSEYFTEPYLAVLPDRRLVVSDSSSGTLQIFSAAGILEKKLSLDPALGPWKPEGVAVGPGGKLWVADRQGNRIVVLAAEALR
jgi:DNA-binding beta-propeller fold protein YncE